MKKKIHFYLLNIAAGILLIVSRPWLAVAANSDFLQWAQQQQLGVQQQKQAFEQYKDKKDKEFTAFLKAQWITVDLKKGQQRDITPKPVVMPVAPPEPEISTPQKPQSVPKPVVVNLPPSTPLIPPIPVPADVVPVIPLSGEKITIEYYGRSLSFYYDRRLQIQLAYPVGKNAISDYWSGLSHADYDRLLVQLNQQKTGLKLTDWAYAVLVHKISDAIDGSGSNESALLSWFLLTKSAYQARIAYSRNKVYLLIRTQQKLFDLPYFRFAGKRYYAVSFNNTRQFPGEVYTYDSQYPGNVKALNMKVTAVVGANAKVNRRELSFRYKGQLYSIKTGYDQGRIDFFRSYPQMSLPLYFSSGVETEIAKPLKQQLANDMKNMSEQQAVNFLLRFVQTALHYKTDQQQFGEENYLFPEETLYYPYSDCEDRAVLFAWLVKNLLGLDVIGLDYPGHVAAAVYFNEKVKGDSVNYKGRKYMVTDPTYINADAGMTMPDYKKIKPVLITY